jgi:uncharacterized membrane protein
VQWLLVALEDAVAWDKMVNELYNCFGYGMMNGGYGYGWIFFSWLIGLLVVAGLVLFIVWMFRKIRDEEHIKNRRRK